MLDVLLTLFFIINTSIVVRWGYANVPHVVIDAHDATYDIKQKRRTEPTRTVRERKIKMKPSPQHPNKPLWILTPSKSSRKKWMVPTPKS